MGKAKAFSVPVLISICLTVFAGCSKAAKERDEARIELEKAKAQLAKTTALLKLARDERNQLQENITNLLEAMAETKQAFGDASRNQEILQDQIKGLIEQLNASIARENEARATVKNLQIQLQEKTAVIQQLEQENNGLQSALRRIEARAGQPARQQSEEPSEEPQEEPEEYEGEEEY